MRVGCTDELSFGTWSVDDVLPDYDDEVTAFGLDEPYDDLVEVPVATAGVPVDVPHHPSFPVSAVVVPIRSRPLDVSSPPSLKVQTGESFDLDIDGLDVNGDVESVQPSSSETVVSDTIVQPEESCSRPCDTDGGKSSPAGVTLPRRQVKEL